MDEETKGTLRSINERLQEITIILLQEIAVILKRIEERQIRTTAMVEDVEKKESAVGSFASTNQ